MSKNKGKKRAKQLQWWEGKVKEIGQKPAAQNRLRVKDGINRNSVRHQRKGQR